MSEEIAEVCKEAFRTTWGRELIESGRVPRIILSFKTGKNSATDPTALVSAINAIIQGINQVEKTGSFLLAMRNYFFDYIEGVDSYLRLEKAFKKRDILPKEYDMFLKFLPALAQGESTKILSDTPEVKAYLRLLEGHSENEIVREYRRLTEECRAYEEAAQKRAEIQKNYDGLTQEKIARPKLKKENAQAKSLFEKKQRRLKSLEPEYRRILEAFEREKKEQENILSVKRYLDAHQAANRVLKEIYSQLRATGELDGMDTARIDDVLDFVLEKLSYQRNREKTSIGKLMDQMKKLLFSSEDKSQETLMECQDRLQALCREEVVGRMKRAEALSEKTREEYIAGEEKDLSQARDALCWIIASIYGAKATDGTVFLKWLERQDPSYTKEERQCRSDILARALRTKNRGHFDSIDLGLFPFLQAVVPALQDLYDACSRRLHHPINPVEEALERLLVYQYRYLLKHPTASSSDGVKKTAILNGVIKLLEAFLTTEETEHLVTALGIMERICTHKTPENARPKDAIVIKSGRGLFGHSGFSSNPEPLIDVIQQVRSMITKALIGLALPTSSRSSSPDSSPIPVQEFRIDWSQHIDGWDHVKPTQESVTQIVRYIMGLVNAQPSASSADFFRQLIRFYQEESSSLTGDQKQSLSLALRQIMLNYIFWRSFYIQESNLKDPSEKESISRKLEEFERKAPGADKFLPEDWKKLEHEYKKLQTEDPSRDFHQAVFFAYDRHHQPGLESEHVLERVSPKV